MILDILTNDWVAGIMILTSIFLIGEKLWYGWIFSIIGQIMWIYIGFDKEVYGMVFLNAAMMIIAFRSLYQWKLKYHYPFKK